MGPSPSTLKLVAQARQGDPRARAALLERYYQDWLDRFHGDLGTTVRKLYDTVDLVQSAVADALRDLPQLRSEGLFYTWVTSIIRHKIAARRRRLRREEPLPAGPEGAAREPAAQTAGREALEGEDTYSETLDAVLELFPDHPEEMAAVSLKLLDDRPVVFIARFLDLSERTAFRRIEDGVRLLKRRLEP